LPSGGDAMRFLRATKMKTIRDASSPATAAPPAGELPPMPSEDQPYFDESLRASVLSLGRLIQKRRKVDG
jgi:hypothetical protein